MAYPDGLQLGGGVTSTNAADFLNAGASHVIVTSFVFREGRLEEGRLQELVWCGACAVHVLSVPKPTTAPPSPA